jgi:hypothetical protein
MRSRSKEKSSLFARRQLTCQFKHVNDARGRIGCAGLLLIPGILLLPNECSEASFSGGEILRLHHTRLCIIERNKPLRCAASCGTSEDFGPDSALDTSSLVSLGVAKLMSK